MAKRSGIELGQSPRIFRIFRKGYNVLKGIEVLESPEVRFVVTLWP